MNYKGYFLKLHPFRLTVLHVKKLHKSVGLNLFYSSVVSVEYQQAVVVKPAFLKFSYKFTYAFVKIICGLKVIAYVRSLKFSDVKIIVFEISKRMMGLTELYKSCKKAL